jgi:hypothetical protein
VKERYRVGRVSEGIRYHVAGLDRKHSDHLIAKLGNQTRPNRRPAAIEIGDLAYRGNVIGRGPADRHRTVAHVRRPAGRKANFAREARTVAGTL